MYCQNNHLLAAIINCKTTEKQYFAKVEGPKTMILVRGICATEGELVGKKILLVCTLRHGGHVGSQEQKHFSPLGTKLYFHVNSSRKILLF